jgi:DHA1 family multidrug resistance protein-like MFS transporter
MPHWKRNVVVLCLAQGITITAFSIYFSFIAFYIQELGVSDPAEVASWLAMFDGGSATAMMLFAPIWGSLSDRIGRKLMFGRALLAGSVLAFLMGAAQSPLQLVILRVFSGALCGTVAAANTLVASETPEEHLGQCLGAMQTMLYAGSAVGPLIGGVIADTFGYRAAFPISGGMMAVSFLMVILLVRETRPERESAQRAAKAPRARLTEVVTRGNAVLMLAMGSTSFAVAVLNPVLSLYIQSLSPGNARIATLAGSVMAASAVTSSIAALSIGRLADKVGQKRLLLVCSAATTLIYAPLALANSVSQLLILRALQGFFLGGLMPTTNALLAKATPAKWRGTIFGLASSFQAGGRAVGPALGAGVAGMWGMASNFWVAGAIFAVITVLVSIFVHVAPAPAPSQLAVVVADDSRATRSLPSASRRA